MEEWRLIFEKDTSSAYGLAVDDALMRSVAHEGAPPTLHMYNFVPAVILGRYQDLASSIDTRVCEELGYEYNRRHTGGGTVLMGPHQVAFGFAIGLEHPKIEKRIRHIFPQLSEIIGRGLGKIGVESGFRPKNDIEVRGRKLAGLSASLEERNTLFFHMSLLVDFDVPVMLRLLRIPVEKISDKIVGCFQKRMTTVREECGRDVSLREVQDLIVHEFAEAFGIRFVETGFDDLSPFEKTMTRRLEKERYGSNDWIYSTKHPKSRAGMARLKTPGGMLEVYLALSGASIESVLITGDFFSTTDDLNRIEAALKWTAADRETVLRNLREAMKGEPIFGVDAESLTEVIMRAKEDYLRGRSRSRERSRGRTG
jgi:lipoate-protein ligase A